MVRWKLSSEVGYLPNELIPDSFMADTHDLFPWGSEVHTKNKQPIALRLAKAAAREVYGVKRFPSHGPFPTQFTLNTTLNALIIDYGSRFKFLPKENSGLLLY